ncbi:MAG: Phosphopantetheine attachment site [Chloroflexota bacterium]|nr:Phosphopantetheine attachment site [Chloroflexota bacterium]
MTALPRHEIAERIRVYVQTSAAIDPTAEVKLDTPLLEGRLDSAGLMELATFIEVEFGVELDPADVAAENFGSVAEIAGLVESMMDSGPPS